MNLTGFNVCRSIDLLNKKAECMKLAARAAWILDGWTKIASCKIKKELNDMQLKIWFVD